MRRITRSNNFIAILEEGVDAIVCLRSDVNFIPFTWRLNTKLSEVCGAMIYFSQLRILLINMLLKFTKPLLSLYKMQMFVFVISSAISVLNEFVFWNEKLISWVIVLRIVGSYAGLSWSMSCSVQKCNRSRKFLTALWLGSLRTVFCQSVGRPEWIKGELKRVTEWVERLHLSTISWNDDWLLRCRHRKCANQTSKEQNYFEVHCETFSLSRFSHVERLSLESNEAILICFSVASRLEMLEKSKQASDRCRHQWKVILKSTKYLPSTGSDEFLALIVNWNLKRRDCDLQLT